MSGIPFAGLAPDGRATRGGGELAAFDVEAAVRLGGDLRRRAGESTKDVAVELLNALNALEHEGRPAWILLRAFVTRALAELPTEIQAQLRRGPSSPPPTEVDGLYLSLVATRGIEPAWNEVQLSRGHRAIPLGGDAAPMVAELVRQLRIDDTAQAPASTFYVVDALQSPAVPAKSFVTAYGVRSVVGFGLRAWPGESVVVIAFARALVERKRLRAFEAVALYAKLTWIETEEARSRLGEAEQTRLRTLVLEEIVASHETHLRELSFESRRELDELRVQTERDAREGAEQLGRQNRELQRSQRAMLNVIEDLRDAREALASKVEERTRELASANQELQARNRELEEFAYIASHDLQEPLRTVSGYLQMIERRYAAQLGDEGDEFIRFAIDGAQRMQALIESLLFYSRVSSKQRVFETVPLEEALDLALRNLAVRVEETATVVERQALPPVQADRIQMVQLFQNLLSNAIKFAGPRPPRIYVSAEAAGGFCTLVVRDEGIGFDPKFADRIFKIFRRLRRDTPGTGIGLAVCKKIVERHGGSIEARSKLGEGATFIVRLPAEPHAKGDA